MPEISEAITKVFVRTESTNVSIIPFIADGLLTHFFCYYDKPSEINVLWLLEHINEQKHACGNCQTSTKNTELWYSAYHAMVNVVCVHCECKM